MRVEDEIDATGYSTNEAMNDETKMSLRTKHRIETDVAIMGI